METTSKAQTAQAIEVGSTVENFGAIVRVVAIDAERGLLVELIPWSRNGQRQGGEAQRYYANPARCTLVAG